MAGVFVIVAATARPLVGSSVPAAFERFCGERLLDRALALVGQSVDASATIVAAEVDPHAPAPAIFHATTTTDLAALSREAKGRAGGSVTLAIDPRHPLLQAGTLRALVAAAGEGKVVAAGSPDAEPAAVATPAGTSGDGVTYLAAPDRELARIDGKNTLVELERRAYLERAHELLGAGLLIRDPATTRIDGPISFGVDVEIEPGCTLRGPLALGDRVRIGPHCVLVRATIGDDTEVRAFTMVEDASIGERCFIGPYARVRPGTSVGPQGQIGNFVELKAARLGQRNRINHLAFVGDASFGDQVTIGAGTITCNHDGVRSQPTTIGAGAYVGSGCVLVAPITIGAGATVGAGSTLTSDAPPSKLTLARSRQVVVESWRGFESRRR